MSSIRRKFRVSWNGGPLIECQTNAWDMTVSADFASNPGLATFALLHACLVRLEHEPPVKLEEFITQLDDLEAIDDEAEEVPPT